MSGAGRGKIFPDPTRASDCLVLRTWSSGETSIIASVLSGQDGYLRVIAKGARRQQSRLRGLVQPCSLANLEYSWREDRALQYLRGGHLILSPLQDSGSLERTACLMAMVELLDRCRLDRERADALFGFCRDSLSVLSSSDSAGEMSRFYAFELALLDFHGLAPRLNDCSACGAAVSPDRDASVVFDVSQGGVVCRDCRQAAGSTAGLRLDRDTLRYLADLQSRARDTPRAMSDPARGIRRTAGVVLHHFLSYHLEGYRLPAGLDMLRAPVAHSRDPEPHEATEDETA